MNEEAQGIAAVGAHFWEYEMKGVSLSPKYNAEFAGERTIASIHTHPLEPQLFNDPIAQFLMKEYDLTFEESSLLLSMNDIKHTLRMFTTENFIAERMGLPAFNTHEATAGTVLIDANRRAILAGLMPISRLPKTELKRLQEAATDGINEEYYRGRKPETLRKF